MRPDEGGCADLRRSRTARTKLVRSPTYAPARSRRPRAGVRDPRGRKGRFGRCRAGGTPSEGAGPRTRRYRVRRRRAAPPRLPPHPTPARAPQARPTLAGTVPSVRRPPTVIAQRHDPANPSRGRDGIAPGTARADPCCREVKSRHAAGDRANRAPLPLDAGASPELPGIRGECERTARGPWNRARRQHSAIGALSYDTYARAAAPISREGDASRGPAGTRA
jgi:hypothetical protein